MKSTGWGIKDAVFIGLCVLAIGGVVGGMLKRERVEAPKSFQPLRFVSSSSAADPVPPADPKPASFGETRDRVDAAFHDLWQKKNLTPANRAGDFAIARRLSLALTGTVPSIEEIRSLQSIAGDSRVEWWISHLLEDRRSADYLAERFARAYVGTSGEPFLLFRRRRFVSWLSDQILENKPYDQTVRAMIAGDGLWTSNPAVNFISATAVQSNGNKPDEIPLAGRTARAFLGMRIDCLQCHGDKLGNVLLGELGSEEAGTQQDFHQLAAFFGRSEMSLTGIRDEPKRKYEYTYLDETDKTIVAPAVPFNQNCFSGHGNLREQLAAWITHPENRPFARATVNRTWGLLFGRPLLEPVDDIPLHGPWPAELEILTDDFIAHGYDLHRLIRIIAATEVFQRDSEADFEVTPNHDRYWATFPLTRLRPDQVSNSLIQSTWLQTIDADAHIIRQLSKFTETRDFVERYGDPGSDEFNDRGGTITQRLLMMNGELVRERIKEDVVMNASTRIAAVCPDNAQAIEVIYLATLTRLPTDDEREHFAQRFGEFRGVFRRQPIEDLYWVLINSTEFSWNH